MTPWIAFLRGVNVGGRGSLPMKELALRLAEAGLADVRTHVQSGNVVFLSKAESAAALERRIGVAILEHFGIEPRVLALSADALARAIAANPYPAAESAPTTLHLFFLAETPSAPDWDGLARVKIASESYELRERVFYLHAPDGFGTSKLAAVVEKRLGVPATARNWRTATTVLEMAKTLVG